jgi:GNAT superfamily N-acetyltransferase
MVSRPHSLYLTVNLNFSIRPATAADAPILARTVWEGFDSYREFAPPGWDPPAELLELANIRERLRLPDAWCRLAEADGEPAGHVAMLAAREREEPRPPIPGLAHLWMLFVRRRWWGSGIAPRLLRLVVAEAGARGYERMRLYTPAGQARARAFYEREGWRSDGRVEYEPMLGLELVEYRREL